MVSNDTLFYSICTQPQLTAVENQLRIPEFSKAAENLAGTGVTILIAMTRS